MRHWTRIAFIVVALVIGGAVTAGCGADDPLTTGPRPPVQVQQFVTGEAQRLLGADGRFVSTALSITAEENVIDAVRAQHLARSFIRTFGQFFHRDWEKQRGRSIDLTRLRDGRVFFASTPHATLASDVHPGFRNGFGSYYLVTFLEGETPVLMMAVSVHNTDVSIDETGLLRIPKDHGNNFWSQGISINSGGNFYPLSPEEAVDRVGTLTGARTTLVPELQLMGVPMAPVTALWKLTLDRPVTLQNTAQGITNHTTEVFVGAEPGEAKGRDLRRPALLQPASELFPLMHLNADGTTRGPVMTDVAVRPNRAVKYVIVTPGAGTQP